MITNLTDAERRLAGENQVLRGLLAESLSVIETIDEDDDIHDGWMLIMALKAKIAAALRPSQNSGTLL
jgi:hypothetical protein